MKANEAPEKIYLHIEDGKVLNRWNNEWAGLNDVEYTRTDAFIEKACGYFYRCLEDTKVIDDYRNILVPGVQASYTSVEEFIEDFKSYIRGE